MDDYYCREVRQRFAEGGLAALTGDAAAHQHLQGCALCTDALAALARSAAAPAFGTAPEQTAPDVQTEVAQFARRSWLRDRRAFIAFSLLVLAAAGAWLVWSPARRAAHPLLRLAGSHGPATAAQEAPQWLDERAATGNESGRGRARHEEVGEVKSAKQRNRFGVEGPQDELAPHMTREQAREAAANAGILGIVKATSSPTAPRAGFDPTASDEWSNPALGALSGQLGGGFGARASSLRAERSIAVSAEGFGYTAVRQVKRDTEHSPDRAHRKDKQTAPRAQDVQLAAARDTPHRPAFALRTRLRRGSPPTSKLPDTLLDPADETLAQAPTNAAQALLAHYSALKGVQLIDANGYFANSYVPGDPELRSLQVQLADYDRARLLPQSLSAARLDAASQRVAQPFDAPQQTALALYVSASERGITSARRMLLQVGLRATPRYSGQRPAMNVSIVVDARQPLEAAALEQVRALLTAFAAARDPNDKLTLFAAGPAGGMLLTGEAFRHGPLSVALQRLQTELTGTGMSLPEALQSALQHVRGGGDTGDQRAALGSSVAIVVAPRAFGAEQAQLEALAHDSALVGIPVSAFGAGPGANADQLSRLALAGQGNRRMLSAADDAARAVDRELSAVGRVVARALRLRIRLASGVRLVSVLGSQPLDQPQAASVRQAENSLDQRMRHDLGIEQDRGEDEEGVQIVIPSFYAGDSHVVLLDVIAQGPGPIVDVSVRYKDLVQPGNSSMRESLWLSNVELARGPLQRNVLKNLVAFELAQRLRSASDALGNGADTSLARQELDRALALLDSLASAVPELAGDREVESDRALTAEYLSLLAHADQPARRQFTADSLHFASLLKLQPRPESNALTEREAGQDR